MHLSPAIKSNIQISVTILLIPVVTLLTTLLLDWSFIQQKIVRQLIIYAVIIFEITFLVLLLLYQLKQQNNKVTK